MNYSVNELKRICKNICKTVSCMCMGVCDGKFVKYLIILMSRLFLFSEIASDKKKNFEKDQDFLVLPLDVTKFDMHIKAVKAVLDHFGQVWLRVKFYTF